jgi:mRNA-degrading endonuclease toxin of MazEF toxin-antitoxin module
LKHESAANLDHVQTVERSRLVGFIGTLSPAKMRQVCSALAIATGCAP